MHFIANVCAAAAAAAATATPDAAAATTTAAVALDLRARLLLPALQHQRVPNFGCFESAAPDAAAAAAAAAATPDAAAATATAAPDVASATGVAAQPSNISGPDLRARLLLHALHHQRVRHCWRRLHGQRHHRLLHLPVRKDH